MTNPLWMRLADCPLLQPNPERIDPLSLRQVQRLLECSLTRPGCDELAHDSLEEIVAALHADHAAVVEATPDWPVRWQHVRRGQRAAPDPPPRHVLAEVLDREAGVCVPPGLLAV